MKRLLAFGSTFFCVSSLLALAAFPALAASAAACKDAVQVESGVKTVSIAELYTSEGCDSCPPADKWFSTLSLKKSGVVPLAFHVDYWDYIGWKDRFGKAAFGERQRTLVSLQGSRSVYTPQVMLDGKDARGAAFNPQFDGGIRDLAAKPSRADIKLRAQPAADAIDIAVSVSLTDESTIKDAVVYIALTENNLESRVTAGENKGVSLKHDHVVRELSGPFQIEPRTSSTPAQTKRSIAIARTWKREDLNIAAFVQNTRTGQILQAVSTPLCAP